MKATLTSEQLKKRKKTNLIIISAAAVIFLAIAFITTDGEKDDAINVALLQARMERTAKELISQKLKAPSTAKFGPVEYLKKGNDITMRGYVDAENSFGAMLRNSWYVVINFTGTTEADLDSTHKYKIVLNELVQN